MRGIVFLLLLACCEIAVACPPIDKGAFWLPKDKVQHLDKLISKAKRLNKAGQCALEGSFGKDTGKYYITVSDTGEVDASARILRFTLEELTKYGSGHP
jgi:hypothetical protein